MHSGGGKLGCLRINSSNLTETYKQRLFKSKGLLVLMKKLMTREERKKIVRRNQIILGLILVLLMVFSVLGYALSGRGSDEEQGKIQHLGINFIKDNSGYWRFNIQGFNFATQYNPQETQNISLFIYKTVSDYNGKPLYFVGEPEILIELKRNLNYFPLRINDACLDPNCEANLPVRNCTDNLIHVKEPLDDEGPGIIQEENCIIITANYTEQIRYSDAVLFKLLGI